MKILHVISSLDARCGGTSEACAGLALAQAKQGLDVSVLATAREGEETCVVERLGAGLGSDKIRQIGPACGPLARHPALEAAVAEAVAATDIVHLHGVWEEIQYQAARVAVSMGKPFVLAPHGMLDPWSLAQGRWKKRIYWVWRWRKLGLRAAALHFITRSEARLAAPMFDSKIRRIIEPLGTESMAKVRRSSEGEGILFLSRLHPKKNLECLLRACARLRDSGWSLMVAGSGDADYKAQLEGLADELGIGKRVSFPGDLRGSEKAAAFDGAAVFCLPSHQENFGIVVIEALAAGLPVILSPAVGLAEDLVGEKSVSVVDGDEVEWAEAIEGVLGDCELRACAGARGPELVGERFSWQAIGDRWVTHYRDLLKQSL